jgi:hypothetical protein
VERTICGCAIEVVTQSGTEALHDRGRGLLLATSIGSRNAKHLSFDALTRAAMGAFWIVIINSLGSQGPRKDAKVPRVAKVCIHRRNNKMNTVAGVNLSIDVIQGRASLGLHTARSILGPSAQL